MLTTALHTGASPFWLFLIWFSHQHVGKAVDNHQDLPRKLYEKEFILHQFFLNLTVMYSYAILLVTVFADSTWKINICGDCKRTQKRVGHPPSLK
jgi:hypothetical protein